MIDRISSMKVSLKCTVYQWKKCENNVFGFIRDKYDTSLTTVHFVKKLRPKKESYSILERIWFNNFKDKIVRHQNLFSTMIDLQCLV